MSTSSDSEPFSQDEPPLVRAWRERDTAELCRLIAAGARAPNDPGLASAILCDVAESGDTTAMRLLLEQGVSARGHWDPRNARERNRRFHEEHRAPCAEGTDDELDPIPLFPGETTASRAEKAAREEAESFERECSAPLKHEIPLFRAAASGNAECIELLLAAGADPHARDNSSSTAISSATSASVVRALLARGLSLEEPDYLGHRPLELAIICSEPEKVRALIEAGANINAPDAARPSGFLLGVSAGTEVAVLQLLVAAGADPFETTDDGYGAFPLAVGGNNAMDGVRLREKFGYLKALGLDVDQRSPHGKTPLAIAIAVGTRVEVQALCDLGADPNAVCPMVVGGQDRGPHPMLFHAVLAARTDACAKTLSLLEAGANPEASDPRGYTPLHLAVAELCGEAADYPASYTAFFAGLRVLPQEISSLPDTREAFVSTASEFLREYTQEFAATIPIADESRTARTQRRERIDCITALCAYQGWVSR